MRTWQGSRVPFKGSGAGLEREETRGWDCGGNPQAAEPRGGSVRAETSDAAAPGGARASLGSRQHPPPPPPARVSSPTLGRPEELPLRSFQEHGGESSHPGKFGLQLALEVRSARPCGNRTRSDAECSAGLGAPGRRACIRGPGAVPRALCIPRVMGTRARPGSLCRRTAPSLPPGARSHPGAPREPRDCPLQLLLLLP